jgi:hypothetical protein
MAQAVDPAIGFYSVEHSPGLGYTGGYLVLNHGGRPLEFHCTLPVRPSRAHEILYGPTLRDHLIGQRIGPALLERARVRPLLVLVDQPEALQMAELIRMPVALLEGPATGEQGGGEQGDGEQGDGEQGDGGSADSDTAGTDAFASGEDVDPRGGLRIPTILADVAVAPLRIEARYATAVRQAMEKMSDLGDLHEPFQRIREALKEAQQGVSRAA